jgi:tetratricopeptide (TPR) repeat protein
LWEYHLYGDKGYDEMKRAVRATYEQAQRMHAPRALALCQCFNGALEFQAGHWAEAEAGLRESIQLYRELGAASGEALAWQRLGVLQTAQGRLDEAMAAFQEGVVVAERAMMRAHCLTRLYASMTRNRLMAGEIEAADRALALGMAMGERHGNCSTCHALLLPAAVSVRVAQRDFDAAEAFRRQLDEAAERYCSRTWVAMARQSRGELAAAQGDYDGALRDYAEAREGFAASGNEYEAARCLAAIAAIRLARHAPGDADQARAAETEARQVLERLGAASAAYALPV